jgi:hypothetical protein
MAQFSFGRFFGKRGNAPRFRSATGDEVAGGPLPVGRLVSFTDEGPEDAPLFQELEPPAGASPFVVVGGERPAVSAGGLAGSMRGCVDEGFTAGELSAVVPPQYVRPGGVPSTQVIPLPHGVLRASLNAGQPAVLLSQLHQACPELFFAPGSLDEDLVIPLPPHKVQRLVARGETAAGCVPPPLPTSLPVLPPERLETETEARVLDLTSSVESVFAHSAAKAKLPPPRRRFEEMQADQRPGLHRPVDVGGATAFGEVPPRSGRPEAEAKVWEPGAASSGGGPSISRTGASPFRISAALPPNPPSPGGGFPRRFESPFAIVSPGDVPAALESPFARHPLDPVGRPPASASEAREEPAAAAVPEPPATVQLSLAALVSSQTAETLGFAPEKVPASVRVTLATAPLLAQVGTGRIFVPLREVIDGLDAKYRPAFARATPDLELQVPLSDVFDLLPEVARPTPVAPRVDTLIETPFSRHAAEDEALNTGSSPFLIVPDSAPAETAPPPVMAMPPASPPPPPLISPLPPVLPLAEAPPTPPPFKHPFEIPGSLPPSSASPPLAAPPAHVPLPPPPTPPALAANPFALAPGTARSSPFALDLPLLPFDEDPVSLESLREDEAAFGPPTPVQSAPVQSAPVQPAPVRPASFQPASFQPAPVQPVSFQPPPTQLEPVRPLPAPIPKAAAPSEPDVPPVPAAPAEGFRFALSEQQPVPPAENEFTPAEPVALAAATPIEDSAAFSPIPPWSPSSPSPFLTQVPLEQEVQTPHFGPAGETATEPPAVAAPSPFLAAAAFDLPPLPSELSQPQPAAQPVLPPPPLEPSVSPSPEPLAASCLLGMSEAPPFTLSAPTPTDDDRAAFASVFAPSALASNADGSAPFSDVDSLPAIALAKLPPIGDPPSITADTEASVGSVGSSPPPAASLPATTEDLSFGYIDNTSQLALRAVFATDRTLDPQEVVTLVASLDGLAAGLLLGPGTRLHSAPRAEDTEDVRQFHQRAASLYEKTVSLVRELEPEAREHTFTLRTAKGVVSFFAIDDVCLAVLHAEPSFRPGVREKLTLVTRSLTGILAV